MRPDMGKCVIERGRSQSSAKSVKARAWGRFVTIDGEIEYEGLQRLPASRKGPKLMFHDCKDSSDVLGPLEGYLRNSCGRLWDDVYSEIAYHLGRFTKKEGIRHIIDAHLPVAVNTFRATDGKVYEDGKHGVDPVGGFRTDFYVEPETGILREAANYRKWRGAIPREAAAPVEYIPLGENREYRRISGIWYFREFETSTMRVPVVNRHYLRAGVVRYEEETVLIWEKKKQLNKKELKRLGLKNVLA